MSRIIFVVLIAFTFISCSGDKEKISQNIRDKVHGLTDSELVNELIIKTDGDKEQIARVLECSIYTIDRIKEKKTFLTENARVEFENILFDIEFNGTETLIEKDPYYDSWFRSFRHWLNKYKWWALAAFLLFFLITFSGGDPGITIFIDSIISIVFLGGYLITWIGNLICPYENPSFLFIEKINHLFEVLI